MAEDLDRRNIDELYVGRTKLGTDFSFKRKILWKFVVLNAILHIGAIYGLSLISSTHYLTHVWAFFLWFLSVQGVVMGAHRLYSHRSYKAKFPVRLVLIICHTLSGQMSAYRWAKDHRAHHKYTDTDADPYNTKRGYFYAHYGWTFVQKHPLVYDKLKQIDDSDLKSDKLLMFQKKHVVPLHLLSGLIVTLVPVYFWGESFKNSLYISYFLRVIIVAHCIGSINSIAHAFGDKPYEKSIRATDKLFVSSFTGGEGWHNYHHTFPWDYQNSEFGSVFNVTAKMIEILAYFGLASGLRSPSPAMIKARVLRTGDGSHPTFRKDILEARHKEDTIKNVSKIL